jgi:hypothetical protein
MRTTLTLDDDVAALLRRTLARRKTSMKRVVNDALRAGLREMNVRPKARATYRTPAVSLGRCRVGSIDDVHEVLALAEGNRLR